MRTISLGKWRRLQQTAGPLGTFTILAIDHRGPLRRKLAGMLPPDRVDCALADLKEDVVRALGPLSTAVLLDPEVGVPRCLQRSALPARTGLLVALDTGSTGDPARLETGLVPDWSAAHSLRVGAAGAKLLVYYHPDATDAPAVEALVEQVARDCAECELPLFLEPLAFDPAQPGRHLPSAERRRVVVATARRLVPLGVDVLKAEFPVNVADEPDEAVWRDACAELNEACAVPWALLSAGLPFEVFLRQAQIAGEQGASGVIAGRALWADAVTPDPDVRRRFLACMATERLRRVAELCESAARPFQALCQPGNRVPAVIAG